MTSAASARTAPRREKVGEGNHSVVYRRPGAAWCVQVFKPDCPELTPAKVAGEYAYLVQAYAELPDLIPYQRLFTPRPDAHISEALVVKQWIEVDPALPFASIRRPNLSPGRRDQFDQFISITRDLLYRAREEETLLPDILDPRWENLAYDVDGRLRLIDTNRLISTRALRPPRLSPGARLNLDRRPHHAKWLRRLMVLEHRLGGRTRTDFRADPLYRRYLTGYAFDVLFTVSTDVGEPIG